MEFSIPRNAGPGVNKQQQRHFYFHFSATVSAEPFQLRAYEQGTRAKLNQIYDDLRDLRRESDPALRDLKTKHESGMQRWTSESRRCVLCHVSPLVLRLRLYSRRRIFLPLVRAAESAGEFVGQKLVRGMQ